MQKNFFMLFKLQVCIVNYRIMTDISISKQYYFFIKQQNILCQRTKSKNTFYPCCTTANRFPKNILSISICKNKDCCVDI